MWSLNVVQVHSTAFLSFPQTNRVFFFKYFNGKSKTWQILKTQLAFWNSPSRIHLKTGFVGDKKKTRKKTSKRPGLNCIISFLDWYNKRGKGRSPSRCDPSTRSRCLRQFLRSSSEFHSWVFPKLTVVIEYFMGNQKRDKLLEHNRSLI